MVSGCAVVNRVGSCRVAVGPILNSNGELAGSIASYRPELHAAATLIEQRPPCGRRQKGVGN